ncbi:hypothetical protein PISL3812_09772 [Talaromyces islandicus]|uniref:Bleomycin resistance protein n=1 Tax=Talaromyces islandicus TaxID=28573 RepID=A0A0U1MCN0_TALIS|nr:hypothetical protein PISL3812_09772 [Talaromyces islandicus]
MAKADEFYLDYLGFKIDWDHRSRKISRENLILHLSEYHGDGSSGVQVRIWVRGISKHHRELSTKEYQYMRPGIQECPAASSQHMGVIDPCGNQIKFCQDDDEKTQT